jgi:hypothetical protein
MQTKVSYQTGRLTISDPRVFHPGRQRLARPLMEQLGASASVRSALIDLDKGVLTIDWSTNDGGTTGHAAVFTAALHTARQAEGSCRVTIRCPFQSTATVWMTRRVTAGTLLLRGHQSEPGHLQLRIVTAPTKHPPWDDLLDSVGSGRGVLGLRVRRWPAGLDVDFDPEHVTRDQVLDAFADAWQAGPLTLAPMVATERTFVVRGPRRLLYLATGCGSFVMAIVGLAVPGVPTVPFLLASSYYLARSSRSLHRRLLDSRLFGQLLREWEAHRAMSRESKRKLAVFTVTVILISAAFAPLSPALLAMIAVMAALSLYGIGRIPELQTARLPELQPA